MSSALIQRVKDGDKPRLVREPVPVPQPGAHELLVKVSHAGQNPTDGEIVPPSRPSLRYQHFEKSNHLIAMRSATVQCSAATLSARWKDWAERLRGPTKATRLLGSSGAVRPLDVTPRALSKG